MRSVLASFVGIFCVVALACDAQAQGVETVDEGTTAPVLQEAAEDAGVPVVEDSVSAAPVARTGKPARGVRLDKNGQAIGYIVRVEPNSLSLVPIPGAVVTFMQNMRIIAQAQTDVDGRFSAANLTPRATYSLFVSSESGVAVSGTCVLPPEEQDDQDAQTVSNVSNRFLFVSYLDENADGQMPDGESEVEYQVIQTVPWEDFYAALNILSPSGPGAPAPGGSGGGGGSGAGAAIGAAAAAAAIGGAIGAGGDEDLATPFIP